MTIAITGANGFIGAELVKYFSDSHKIIALQRKSVVSQNSNVVFRGFDLRDFDVEASFSDADVVIHTAYIRYDADNKDSSKVNSEATIRIHDYCISNNKHFIFLSSMSAHSDALSEYGKHKFLIERKVDLSKVTVLKLGLVAGESGGLYCTIKNTVKKLSIIPLIDGGKQPVQILHIYDCCKVIELIAVKRLSGLYHVASPEVLTLKQLYEGIALAAGRKPFFVSVPYFLMKSLISVIQILKLPFPVSDENLIGLKQLRAFDTAKDMRALAVKPLSFSQIVGL